MRQLQRKRARRPCWERPRAQQKCLEPLFAKPCRWPCRRSLVWRACRLAGTHVVPLSRQRATARPRSTRASLGPPRPESPQKHHARACLRPVGPMRSVRRERPWPRFRRRTHCRSSPEWAPRTGAPRPAGEPPHSLKRARPCWTLSWQPQRQRNKSVREQVLAHVTAAKGVRPRPEASVPCAC